MDVAKDPQGKFLLAISSISDSVSDMDISTTDDCKEWLAKLLLEMDDSDPAFTHWIAETLAWLTFETQVDGTKRFVAVKTDAQQTYAACYAAYKSFELVIEQLRRPRAPLWFSAKRTIKSLRKRLLALFDFYCKNLSIENCWDVVNLKDSILQAADLAKDFMSSHRDQINFLDDGADYYDDKIAFTLRSTLLGNQFVENFQLSHLASHMQDTMGSLQDDDHLVGLSGDLQRIKERVLTENPLKLEILPILGMAGIGKTTLARRVYEDPQIVYSFHVRAWTTVSQKYQKRDVLQGLLESIAPLTEEHGKRNEELDEWLYKLLKGRRYFIVLDDVWETKAWDDMKFWFPNDNNCSRIVLTSRLTEVAVYASPSSPPYWMNFLSREDSLSLLCKKVFAKETCPPQLVDIGVQIAERCQGLPLIISVVAGYLSKVSKTRNCWVNIAERIGSLIDDGSEEEQFFNILSLSYKHLPNHLKACFLSMGIFPKNSEIPVRKLTRLWTAMQFLHPERQNNMEEVAENCLEELISRSLIMVRKRKFDGKVKSCGTHDLLWDLGMREARKEGQYIFCHTPSNDSYFNTSDGMKYVMDLTRTLLYYDQSFESDCPLGSTGFKLLTVLDIINQSLDHFPDEITDLVNLRYLALSTCEIPHSVSKLRHLESFINSHELTDPVLPKEIWLLAHLRHLHVETCTHLPDPPSAEIEGSCVSVLRDLQTLTSISSASCTKEVFLKIPNLKELGIQEIKNESMGDELFNCLSNAEYLDKLQKLKLCCDAELEKPRRIPQWVSFVPNIKKLTLIASYLPWNEMNALAMLPNLEVLKLKQNAFRGPEWEMDDEEFLQLKCLLLESLDLVHWKANKDHFPILQCLVIKDCGNLFRIPLDFGELSSLQLIEIDNCNLSTFASARVIQIEQVNLGNERLTVRVGRADNEVEIWVLAMAFVYMTLRLKMLRAKHYHSKRKKKG